MTREEGKEFANALKNNYTIDFDKLAEFCDLVISALSEKDWKFYYDHGYAQAKRDLSENKGDLISRQDAIDAVGYYSCYSGDKLLFADKPLKALPSVENKGEWIMPIQDDGMSDPIYYQVRCSKCGFDLDPQTWHQELHQYGADNFCPNCGARMKGGE